MSIGTFLPKSGGRQLKIVIPGGSGHTGRYLTERFRKRGDEVVVLSRGAGADHLVWDGRTLGDWVSALDGADVLINLAGRSVNCRYTPENLKAMMDSRVESTRVLGEAVASVGSPPRVWLNASTATIYAHSFDRANDEATGEIGGDEADAPRYWSESIRIALAWEEAFFSARTVGVRQVEMRTAMTMSAVPGSVFSVLVGLARKGLLGRLGSGRQVVSWIHEEDMARAVDFLIERDDLEGAVNLTAPEPLPSETFHAQLREAFGVKVGLPAAAWMLEIGAWAMKTDTELLLKSRNVVPRRLVESGFTFLYPTWREAVRELAGRV